uniref:IC97/Casc1 N-terminal domain-containing protein n=1 Tax=Alexandrium monilatum TaxID=311494 RepID=A0A7S4WHC6_9DINO
MGRKPKKKSKKQLEEELQKAAEEQKKQEEKERLLKEEEDARNAEAARLAQEQDDKEKALEAERLEEESVIVNRMKGQRQKDLLYEQSKLQDRINWQKYISCNTRPNVAFENEITTYMTMVREDQARKMEDAMRKCHESEEIVGDLMELWCKAKEEGETARQEWCMRYVYEIRALEMEVMDDATSYLLQYIEKQEQNSHSHVYLSWGQQFDDIKVGFWGHLQNKGFRNKQIDHPKIQISLELPKSIALQQSMQSSMGSQYIGVRSLYTTYDSAAGKDPSVMPVGGMIRVDLLMIPPFSKKVKGWTIRQIPPPGQELMRLPFPNTEPHTASTAMAVQPCKIEYKVPAHVLVRKNPTISWWDKDTEKWSTEGITEISWETDSRKISFFSARLAAFSITQERHLDLPYQYWSMRPVAPLMCELAIQAARYMLHFVISEDGLRLKGPDLPELRGVMFTFAADGGGPEDMRRVEHPVGPISPKSGVQQNRLTTPRGGDTAAARAPRVRSPATLLRELRDCGLNLMPEDADAEFLDGYTPKDPETQARAYSDLSEIAGHYDITSSRHNKKLPKEQALLRVRENPLFEQFDPLDPDCDTDYQAVMFYPDKACFSPSLELQPVKTEVMPGHTTHASLYLCYERVPDPPPNHADQLQRLEVTCTNVRFVEAVRQTMQLMQLLSFV